MTDLTIVDAHLVSDWMSPGQALDIEVAAGRIRSLRPGGTTTEGTVIDVGGAVVAPAFGDGHVHPIWAGLQLLGAPVRDATSVAEVVAAVADYAAANPDESWIEGGSYDPALAPGGLFDARWLDVACADRPVVLTSSDQHCIWANTRALEIAGIDADCQPPPGGEIPRRSDGSVLGTLREWEAMELLKRHVPRPDGSARASALARATSELAAHGVTTILDAAVSERDVHTYLEGAESGRLKVRVELALRADPERFDPAHFASLARDVRQSTAQDNAGDPWVAAGTVKFFSDGVVEAGTAALLEPYADNPHTCGLPVWDAAGLALGVADAEAAGFDVHIHAIGDAGIRNALDAVEASPGRRDPRRRPTIAHVQVLHPNDRGRFARLGVTANFEPLWACWDACQRELTAPRLGPERTAWQYPIGSLMADGVEVSFGTDWPVSDVDPLRCAAVAVSRRIDGGRPLVAAERISAGAALRAASQGVAQQLGHADWGHVSVGARADLVVLSADPRNVPPDDWTEIEVLGRFQAGIPDGR